MEMTQLFTFLVLGICATHLVWTAGAQITSWWDARHNNQARNTAITARPVQQRGDWYVFFNCSDLLGPDPVKKNPGSVKEDKTLVQKKNQRPQIRPSAL
jgi:hypothetical protein